jgi:hypothetical protein
MHKNQILTHVAYVYYAYYIDLVGVSMLILDFALVYI